MFCDSLFSHVDFLGNLNRSDSLTATSDKCFHLQLPISSTVFIQSLSLVWEEGFQGCLYCCGISSSTSHISCNCYFQANSLTVTNLHLLTGFHPQNCDCNEIHTSFVVLSCLFPPCLEQFNFCPASKVTRTLLKHW